MLWVEFELTSNYGMVIGRCYYDRNDSPVMVAVLRLWLMVIVYVASHYMYYDSY